MAVYAIGDIHGCMRTLHNLLEEIGFSPSSDTLWLTGDLVNRGAQSLDALRWAKQHQQCVKIVLGNHDLHLLAMRDGAREATAALQPLLAAPDAKPLCDFLQAQPLLYYEDDYVLLHAGRMPQWELAQAQALAQEAQIRIRRGDFFYSMYGDLPARWHPALSDDNRHRLIINAFTRLRILNDDGSMALSYSGPPQHRPAATTTWFDFVGRKRWSATVICGHWSSLGLVVRPDLLAIDTGCLWGRCLTAVRLEDRKIFQVPAHAKDVIK